MSTVAFLFFRVRVSRAIVRAEVPARNIDPSPVGNQAIAGGILAFLYGHLRHLTHRV